MAVIDGTTSIVSKWTLEDKEVEISMSARDTLQFKLIQRLTKVINRVR